MKRMITLLSVCLLAAPLSIWGQAAKPQWKSRAEYDAYVSMTKATSPQQKIQLADAFLTKYPNSDFKAGAYQVEVQSYQQLGQTTQAIDAAQQSLKSDPNDLFALNYLSFVLPYTYKPNAPNAATELSDIQSEAKQGLQLLQQQKPPAGTSPEQFAAAVKQSRFNFNRALGFAALQQKDYPSAVNYLKAAAGDNPNDSYTFYFLGEAYLNSNPPDYNNGLWDLARSAALAKNSNPQFAQAAQKSYSQYYEYHHGSNAGENQVLAQAASSPEPPSGFNVSQPTKHSPTGNPVLDAFYSWQDALSLGGDTAQNTWNQIKGQQYGVLAYVESVQPGDAPGTYNVRATIVPQDQGKEGMYNLILQTNEEDAKYLKLGNPLRFKGSISAYTVTPQFVLTVSNVEIDPKVLQAAKDAATAGKTAPTRRRRR